MYKETLFQTVSHFNGNIIIPPGLDLQQQNGTEFHQHQELIFKTKDG